MEESVGFPQLRPLLPPRPQGSQPQGGRGTLITGCRCPAGARDRVDTLQAREAAWAPREPPGKPEVWQQGLLLPPRAPATGPGAACPGPGSPQVNAFWGHQGQAAADSFMEKGILALGDGGRSGHTPFLGDLTQTLES